MEAAVSDVGVCNLAYAGRLEELRAQLLRDRALATKTDQVSRLRPFPPAGARAGGLWGRFPRGGCCQPPSRRPLTAALSLRTTGPRCTGPARRDTRTSPTFSSASACLWTTRTM